MIPTVTPQSIHPTPHVTRHGATIPKLGLGTWRLRGDACTMIVTEALKLGYAHIDTAQGYGNEAAVGEGLAASGVPREEVFITTKVMPTLLGDGPLQRSVEESLERLEVGHVDLLLVHWPNPDIPLSETIRALNQVKREGLTRHIGVSNFTSRLLEEALALTEEPIAVEQLELHPYLDQSKMLATLRRHGMAITAYSPIAHGQVADDPIITAIGRRHRKTPAQVTLRWLIQQEDVIAIPRTSRVERLEENFSVFDFTLSDREMAQMSSLTRPGARLINEPTWVKSWD